MRTPADASVANTAPSDARTQESKALRETITAVHLSSLVPEGAPYLFNDAYSLQFTQTRCANLSSSECTRKFDQAVFATLAQRYFAADPVAVQRTCLQEPLICDDLNTLETLFIRMHNASVMESEREKLNRVEDWSRGQLTDDELKSALHFDFKFENGKLLVLQPQA